MQRLARAGVDVNAFSPILRDVIWSTAVQHGPASNIVLTAINTLGKKATEADLVKKIYALRWNGGKNFARSTENVKNAVYRRFFGKNGELATALNRLNSQA